MRANKSKMSTLKSFSFGSKDELPEQILLLFEDLVLNPDMHIDCCSEIIDAAFNGNINFNEPFNILGYDSVVKFRTRLRNIKETGHVCDMSNLFKVRGSDDLDSDTHSDKLDLLAGKYSRFITDSNQEAFKYCEDNADVESSKKWLLNFGKELKECECIDLLKTIRGSLIGCPSSFDKLKELCSEYRRLSECLQILLSSPNANLSEWLESILESEVLDYANS